MTALVFDQCFAFGRRSIRKPETRFMVRPIVRTTELRRLLRHWYDLRGDRPLPHRCDLVLAAFFQTDRSIGQAVDWLSRVPAQDR